MIDDGTGEDLEPVSDADEEPSEEEDAPLPPAKTAKPVEVNNLLIFSSSKH